MSFFVNLYEGNQASQFLSTLEGKEPGALFAVGFRGNDGLVARVDHQGFILWEKIYRRPGNVINFRGGVTCANGDLLLYGSRIVKKDRSHHLLVRIDSNGNPLWGKVFHSPHSRAQVRLVPGQVDTYVFAGWNNPAGKTDNVEIATIADNGRLLNSALLQSGGDDQLANVIPHESGFILVGETSSGPGWDGFAAFLDAGFRPGWMKRVGAGGFETVADLLPLDEERFLITGNVASNSSHLTVFDPLASTVQAQVFDMFPGISDRGRQRLAQVGNRAYMIAYPSQGVDYTAVLGLNASFRPEWAKKLSLPQRNYLFEMVSLTGKTELWLSGRMDGAGNKHFSLLAKTDLSLHSCVTDRLNAPVPKPVPFKVRDWNCKISGHPLKEEPFDVQAIAASSTKTLLCPQKVSLDLGESYRLQSPYLYLQAVGSDETDGSARGIHLRWDLIEALGENHLPKGNLTLTNPDYQTTQGFNRPDDFVRIHRVPYEDDAAVSLDLRTPPQVLEETGILPTWSYPKLGPGSDGFVRFTDRGTYVHSKTSFDPMADPARFLADYDGVIELGLEGKPVFELVLSDFRAVGPKPVVSLELVSFDPRGNRTISCRKRFGGFNQLRETLTCENIEYVRLRLEDTEPGVIAMSAYLDFLLLNNQGRGSWELLGEFALSDDNAVVFNRLEDLPRLEVDRKWPKFNEGDPVTGAFKVNVANYKDRWLPSGAPDEGLRFGVVQYLKLSTGDAKANDSLPSGTPGDDARLDISFLDMLRLVAVDYHVACMLGLGHKDAGEAADEATRYLYVADYKTFQPITDADPKGPVTHLYMSLPTSQLDHRLPPEPELEPPSYGLFVDNGTPHPTELTLPGGYDRHADVRYVRLAKRPFAYEQGFGPFFADPTLFCAGDETEPVLFGVEYRDDTEPAYRRPEISADPFYKDHAGLDEVAPVPESGETDQPIFIHRENEEGIRRYALYSINCFSRVSQPGNEIVTDRTRFPVRNTLLPPHNLAVQLIQPEQPRIFTTEQEQNDLANLAADKVSIRVTFDWNHVHNIAWQFADRVEFFFRETEPLNVRGEVAKVTDLPDFKVRVETASYAVNSLSPPRTVTPVILQSRKNSFIGSAFTVGGREFSVVDIVAFGASGQNPVFILRNLLETQSADPLNQNEFITLENHLAPEPGDRFLVVENMTIPESWDQKLTRSTGIDVLDKSYLETETTVEGAVIEKPVAGLAALAQVSHVLDGQAETGVYKALFAGNPLPAPPPGASWHKGIVRIDEDAQKPGKKTLQVWDIDAGKPNLELTIHDAGFSTPGSRQIKTGTVAVNFHPGYWLYLESDTAPNAPFLKGNILPKAGQGTKMTYIAARSLDTSAQLASPICPPVPLLAQEIIEPKEPERPVGPLYATSPNHYGMSTYSFDVGVDLQGREPYALVFYRAEAGIILDTLYKAETIHDPVSETGILIDLAALPGSDAAFFTNRWNDLVNVDLDGSHRFKQYVPGGFRFPMPDNPAYVIPNSDPTIQDKPFANPPADLSGNFTVTLGKGPPSKTESRSYVDIVRNAVEEAFTALTEQPVIYRFLKSGRETSSRAPLIRDQAGNLLEPGSADPFPMAVKLDDGSIRFTDYRLSGASMGFYFYFAVELTNQLRTGPASGVLGPVQLVDRSPPEAPALKSVVTGLANPAEKQPATVLFRVNEYTEGDRISAFEIYRTTNPADSLTPRTMTRVKVVGMGDELEDDFSDLAFPPFGKVLYCLVALRRITDENGNAEDVRSKPSKTITAQVVDNINPPAPLLSFSADPSAGALPAVLTNVVLSWAPTCYNGTYYLYRMNPKGNWKRVYQVKSNDPVIQYPPIVDGIPDFANHSEMVSLPKEDGDGNPIYHRFNVGVENASGLLDLRDKPLTI